MFLMNAFAILTALFFATQKPFSHAEESSEFIDILKMNPGKFQQWAQELGLERNAVLQINAIRGIILESAFESFGSGVQLLYHGSYPKHSSHHTSDIDFMLFTQNPVDVTKNGQEMEHFMSLLKEQLPLDSKIYFGLNALKMKFRNDIPDIDIVPMNQIRGDGDIVTLTPSRYGLTKEQQDAIKAVKDVRSVKSIRVNGNYIENIIETEWKRAPDSNAKQLFLKALLQLEDNGKVSFSDYERQTMMDAWPKSETMDRYVKIKTSSTQELVQSINARSNSMNPNNKAFNPTSKQSTGGRTSRRNHQKASELNKELRQRQTSVSSQSSSFTDSPAFQGGASSGIREALHVIRDGDSKNGVERVAKATASGAAFAYVATKVPYAGPVVAAANIITAENKPVAVAKTATMVGCGAFGGIIGFAVCGFAADVIFG